MNKRFALSVGNNYPGTDAELSGCVNDANDWATLLRAQGYEVTVIVEATRAAMLGTLDALVALAGFGDRIVFTYSGHGTWVPDRDGDEADRRDEALVGADFANGLSGLVLDDDLQRTFAKARYGVGILTLSDSCHSGTATRFLPAFEDDLRARFLSPSAIFPQLTANQARDMEAIPASDPRKTGSLISGCDDHEYSYDAWFGNRANGAFTRHAIDTWQSGITLNSWHKAIRTKLPSSMYPQTPMLLASSTYRKYTRAI